jgi:hypothetical protein
MAASQKGGVQTVSVKRKLCRMGLWFSANELIRGSQAFPESRNPAQRHFAIRVQQSPVAVERDEICWSALANRAKLC